MKQAVLTLSGGMDSATLLYHLLDLGYEVKALSVNYGQKHVRELDAGEALCQRLSIERRVIDLRCLAGIFGPNSLTDANTSVPLGHYTEPSMAQTVVPNRNMILLSIAIAWAASLKWPAVAYAAHGGDHAIYPDCRPVFASSMDVAAQLCDYQPIHLLRPFMDWDKGDIAARGVALGVPYELTWTCYQGGSLHCGACGACVERREAFSKHGLKDPTEYMRKS